MKTSHKIFNKKSYIALITILIFFIVFSACKKFVTVDELKDSMLSSQVFNNNESANAAVLGIYQSLKVTTSVAINVMSSFSSDDLVYQGSGQETDDFFKNNLNSSNSSLPWSTLYNTIYRANSAIEGLEAGTGIPDERKKQLLAEAKFLRAYAYFYLVSFFGDVPLLTTTSVEKNSIAPRNASAEVYTLITTDLLNAQATLPADLSTGAGKKTRVNKWAATALLARVYLYQKKYVMAEQEATAVIESGLYTMLDSPNGIFNRNNSEAIFQLDRFSGETFALLDFLTPALPITSANYVLNSSLIGAFEINDMRKTAWLYPISYLGNDYYVPYKFRVKATSETSELETPLRMAEQYLIRAEARAMQDNYSGAIEDINLIRLKHGKLTTPLSAPVKQEDAITIVMHERRVELFTEGGHRWLDLKRTEKLNEVMQLAKPTTWKSTALLYPIPLADLQRNPNLKQNSGYQ